MSKILFGSQPSNNKKQGKEIDYTDLHVGMEVYFEDDESQIILGEITEIFKEGDINTESEYTVGCVINTEYNTFSRYIEDGDKLWSVIVNQESKNLEEQTSVQKNAQKNIPNIFSNQRNTENGYSKFPNWDILPLDQFINPRIKN